MTLRLAIVKRIERASAVQNGQPRHGPCLICGKPWDECKHDSGQIETLIQIYKQEKLLREVGEVVSDEQQR